MKTTVFAIAMVFAVAVPEAGPLAQSTPPRDPSTPLPSYSLDSLWQEIDCECECECCEHIKGLIKKRIKNPRGRPQLSPPADTGEAKPRRQRDAERRKARVRHVRGAEKMWEHPWPRSGDRWIDAARHHRYRKAKRSHRGVTEEQQAAIDENRYRRRLERIDLEAALRKAELKLEHLLRSDDVSEQEIRRQVDAIADIRGDLQFNRVMTQVETRRLIGDDTRERRRKDQ